MSAVAYVQPIQVIPYTRRAPSLGDILRAVSVAHRISARDIVSHARFDFIASARHEFYWLARHVTGRSYQQIGLFLESRHHTTVMHGVAKVAAELEQRRSHLLAALRELGIDPAKFIEPRV